MDMTEWRVEFEWARKSFFADGPSYQRSLILNTAIAMIAFRVNSRWS